MAGPSNQTDIGWQAQVLRLTAFLSAPLDPGVADTLWMSTTSALPEVDENRPREGFRRQSGPFEDGQLEILIAPTRIDWVMAPKVDPNAAPPMYFASFERGIEVLSTSAPQWLRTGSPSIRRLALGAVLLMPASDKVRTYQKLGSMLKSVQVDAVRSSDLFYQINWPRQSNVVPGLRLNRVTKWNALVMRLHNFELSGAVIQSAASTDAHYCRLECDHNTAEEHVEPFEPAQIDKLFQELCRLAIDNVESGEVTAEE
jgi:hypothetical protein